MKNLPITREIRTENTFCYTTHKINFPPHIHDDIEIFYLIEGAGTINCDGKSYTINKGMFFCAFPNQLHSFENFGKNDVAYVMIVKPNFLLAYRDIISNSYPESPVCEPTTIENERLQTLLEIFRTENQCLNNTIKSAYLTLIFGKLLKNFTFQSRTGDPLNQILNYCVKHYTEPITLKELSSGINISQSHLSRIFNYRLNMHFCDYLNTLRIAKSKLYLENTTHSITDIAGMVGFSNLRTFNRAFKKDVNMTPSEYRQSVRK